MASLKIVCCVLVALKSLQQENEDKQKGSNVNNEEVDTLRNKVQSMENDNRTLIANVSSL